MFQSNDRHLGIAVAALLLPLQAIAAQTTAASTAPRDDSIVAMDAFLVTDAKSLTTTLPVRPVAGVYGFSAPLQDLPRSITQINPQQFEQDIISSYSEFARYSPSVNQSTGQIANYGSPTLRGAVSDVYQNGVRMLVRQQNNRPFTLNAYEAADIVAGPAPVIYGPSARTAGYVNYLTKKPYFDDAHTTVTLRFGNLYGDGSGLKESANWTYDTGAPIIKDKLAYRFSYQGEKNNAYYDNVDDKFHDVYGGLAWLPHPGLAVDWNFEYGSFDWLVNNGANRVTDDFIRNGTYLAGPATPIVQVGSSYYSPTLDSSGTVTGWITRSRSGNSYTAGTPTQNPTSNSAAGAGTIVGYVLDPAVVHPEKLSGGKALNAPGFPSTTDAFNTQLRVKAHVSESLSLLNNTIYQYYKTDTSSNGGFYNWITTNTVENRTETLLSLRYLPWLRHESNTGFSYRYESVRNYKDSQANGYGPTGDWFDLTGDPLSFTRNAFFGATVYPFAGSVTDPVLTRFGYLKGFYPYLTVPESPANWVSPGGSGTGLSTATNETATDSLSLYTQHSLKIRESWLLDLGARTTLVSSRIGNPLGLNDANAAIADNIERWLPGYSSSLSYKPFSRLTAYATYAYVMAQNGMTTGSPTWASGNKYDPNNFQSLSELHEAGAKFELIPDKLVGGVSAYRQFRDLTLTTVPGADPILARARFRGVEFNLRYQPARRLNLGANYSYLEALSLNQNLSAPTTLQADNATNIIGTASLGVGNWRIVNLPRNNVTLFGSYQFESGFGAKVDLWARDSYIATNGGTVTVPGGYNVNLGVFYARPTWSAEINLRNLTNERNFAGASTVLEPINAQARITYKY